ncbi:RagB/SusD family nutrient uptake outer membrane protein [Persicitalea jodogahamensis]|uniref:Membrane protein n=1 Tax=Persicitalea jodogahamensis TaxID=402147 RepID=A0A8J3D7E8_9BACT|nr:RagB/SusD family nutrient uptake outer membrane protein [Persicitalea jodogahamensis]GHB84826.1 membrane protein [Persicitalea jodogahamensis]
MKYIQSLFLLVCLGLGGCEKVIDLYPQSNLNTGTYYSTVDEVRAGLTGAYNGMQAPLATEWQLTELRSDNSKQGVPASSSSTNRDLSDLDMFLPATIHTGIYTYWLTTYNNIRNANIVLQRLGVVYDPSAGTLSLQNIDIAISDTDRKQLAGEALFIRSHHYFNLVRLFGGVFLVHTPISAQEAKSINRSSPVDMYKLIEADLKTATTYLSPAKFAQITGANIGRANQWAAKALLGKVYLTLNRKAEAATLLQDVVSNSGYGLQASYASVFSISNEMNSEILFTVRHKAGGLGLGSSFGNSFAALNSGSTIINGSGQGLNTPTTDLNALFNANPKDARKATNIATFGTGTAARLYVPKYLSPVVLSNDGESDWPVIRFADVLLLLAEAQGFTPESIALINLVRARAGLTALPSTVNSVATFEQALAEERRLELAFENHRFFDLLRYNTTLTTIKAVDVLKDHFAAEYASHYAQYPAPILTLPQLQANVTADKLLLPIPQREIDTNPSLTIAQNTGY